MYGASPGNWHMARAPKRITINEGMCVLGCVNTDFESYGLNNKGYGNAEESGVSEN